MERFFSLFFFFLFSTASVADFDARTALAEAQAESQRISKSGLENEEKRLRLNALEGREKHLRKILERERLDYEASKRRKITAATPNGQSVRKVSQNALEKPPSSKKIESPLPTDAVNDSALIKTAPLIWRGIQNLFLWGFILGMVALLVIGVIDWLESSSRILLKLFETGDFINRPTDRSDGMPNRPVEIGRAFGEGVFPGGFPLKGTSSSRVAADGFERPKTVPRDGVVPIHLR